MLILVERQSLNLKPATQHPKLSEALQRLPRSGQLNLPEARAGTRSRPMPCQAFKNVPITKLHCPTH